MPVYTVGQAANYIRQALEADLFLGDLWLSGELSNVNKAPSGHIYFTVKDPQAQLRGVMFRNSGRGGELLRNGAQVAIHGRVSFYERGGDLNFRADVVVAEGTGELHLRLEQLKVKLEADGLFEQGRKRPLPEFPRVVGVVTSPSGAVFHDICNVIQRRCPALHIVLAPAQVQGDSAAIQIANAVRKLNNLDAPKVEVIVVARGGGSLEELWPFNEEVVARAIYASKVPVVSAVGHETDWTIADLVADRRAPTPSAAAEMVAPDMGDLRQGIAALQERAWIGMRSLLQTRRREVSGLVSRVSAQAPDVDDWRRRIDDVLRGGRMAFENRVRMHAEQTSGLERRLRALEPMAIMKRGYAVVERVDGEVVTSAAQAQPGDALKVTVADGSFPAVAGGKAAPAPKPERKKVQERAGAPLL